MASRAETLRSMRIGKRLTQEQVAEKMGVSQSHYSLVERGKKLSEVVEAMHIVSRMRTRSDRTSGGEQKVGRAKSG